MIDPKEIRQHIAGHGLWKARLRDALDGGAEGLDPDDIRPDDRCAFGKWLRAMPSSTQETAHFKNVKELHRLFHLEAAGIVELIQGGERERAETSIRMRGDFSKRTSRLTRAMVAWMEGSTPRSAAD